MGRMPAVINFTGLITRPKRNKKEIESFSYKTLPLRRAAKAAYFQTAAVQSLVALFS